MPWYRIETDSNPEIPHRMRDQIICVYRSDIIQALKAYNRYCHQPNGYACIRKLDKHETSLLEKYIEEVLKIKHIDAKREPILISRF